MTQPINRETAIALAKEAGKDTDFTKHIELWTPDTWQFTERLCNLAVAHSRKDAEPVAWLNPTSSFSVITQEEKNLNSLQYSDEFLAGHTTPLYAHPPEADKLLQQALEYAKLMKLYGPALGYGNTTIDDHIAAIRTYLEGKK